MKTPKYMYRTTNTQIRSAIRKLWLKSRERNRCLALSMGCATCKEERPLEVHHTKPPNWERLFRVIREELLDYDTLECLCGECHDAETKKEV